MADLQKVVIDQRVTKVTRITPTSFKVSRIAANGGGGGKWGFITGTISDQTDLQANFDNINWQLNNTFASMGYVQTAVNTRVAYAAITDQSGLDGLAQSATLVPGTLYQLATGEVAVAYTTTDYEFLVGTVDASPTVISGGFF